MTSCKCSFLDGREVSITVKRDATGQDLFTSVCNYLNISDSKFYGLVHKGGVQSVYNWWINLDKPLRKQLPGRCQIWAFALMIKYYPLPRRIPECEDITRFHTVLQTRQDLLTGRLKCPAHTLALLASYWLQSEYGDFANEGIDRQLVEAFRFIGDGTGKKKEKRQIDMDIDLEEQMIELHRCLRGTSPSEADMKFLKLAASLEMYGVHFYPAYANLRGPSKPHTSGVHANDIMTGIMVGIGPQGVVIIRDKKRPQVVTWATIWAVAFKNNSVTIKLHEGEAEKTVAPYATTFEFDDLQQAKTFWRTAVDIHVRYRIENKESPKEKVSIKLSRQFSMLGKKQATLKKKRAPPSIKRPALSVIKESPASKPRKPDPKPKKKETKPKGGIETKPKGVIETKPPAKPREIPTKEKPQAPSSPASRMSKKTDSPRSNLSPKPSPTVKRTTLVATQHPAPGDDKDKAPGDVTTLPYDEKIATAVPQRLRTSKASMTTGDDGSSSIVTDNTEVLCSSNIIEKAFSYAENDGVNSINAWLDLCTPREQRRGRPVSRSAPASHRSKSRGRSPVDEDDVTDIDDYKPLIRSKRPVVIRARDLRDLSPPHTVHYDEEPSRRMPGRYKSCDNVCRKRWSPVRGEARSPDRTSLERRYADVYKQEFLRNLSGGNSDTYRRSRSMYSLRTPAQRDRSASSEHRRSLSPSSNSAIASSGSRRSCDSYLGASYDEEDYYRRYCDLPFESNFARRVFSETRLNKAKQYAREYGGGSYQPQSVLRNSDHAARERRSNVTSWAYGDRGDFRRAASEKSFPNTSQMESIPSIPKFVRSVR